MTEQLRKVLDILGYKVEQGGAQDDTGRTFPLVAFKHGVHQLIAYEEKNGIQLVYPMDIPPEDTALI